MSAPAERAGGACLGSANFVGGPPCQESGVCFGTLGLFSINRSKFYPGDHSEVFLRLLSSLMQTFSKN
jgi:hypothetical protein